MALVRPPVGIDAFRSRAYKNTQSPNAIAHAHGRVVSREIAGISYQACAYYNASMQSVVAVRVLPLGEWMVVAGPRNLSLADSHNTIVLLIDADGYLHYSGDQHNDPLHYYRSNAPLATWTGAWTAALSMLGTNEGEVTYPQFLVSPVGTSYFLFRDGGADDGDVYFYEYDEATTSWSAASGTGTGGKLLDGKSTIPDYNFYQFGKCEFSSDWDGAGTGRMFITFTKREDLGLDNSDIYGISWDGTSWYKLDGTSQTIPANTSNLTVGVSIASSELLFNQCGFCLDANDNPHVVYWKDDGARYQMYDSWYNTSTDAWTTVQITNYAAGAGAYTNVGRPQPRCDVSTNTIYLWFAAEVYEGNGVYEFASDAGDFSTWTKRQFFAGDVDNYEPAIDDAQWMAHGIYSDLITQGHHSDNLRDHVPVFVSRKPAAVADSFDSADWTHSQPITIDSTMVGTGGVSGFTVLLQRSHFADDVCSPTSANAAAIDGGDLRFFADASLTTRIACAVIAWERDSTHGAADAIIALRVGPIDLSDATDTTIYLAFGNANAVQPWVADTYGSSSSFDANWIAYAPMARNTVDVIPAYPYMTAGGQIDEMAYSGGAAQFSPVSDHQTVAIGPLGVSAGFSLAAHIAPDAAISTVAVVIGADDSATATKDRRAQMRLDATGELRLIRFSDAQAVLTNMAGSTDLHGQTARVVGEFDTASGAAIYVGGTAEATDSVLTANRDTARNWNIGSREFDGGVVERLYGGIAHVEIHGVKRGASWWKTDANMIESPALFASAGTVTELGGALTPPVLGEVTGVSLTPTTARITVPMSAA